MDYDHDGVAAGVMFHGSMNMEPIPFISSGLGKVKTYDDRDLASVGMKIYNRWLADFVSQAPHRHIALAYLPMWDVEAAVAEVQSAHDVGLRGVNFPAMQDGELPEYSRSLRAPLWSVCEELRMPLVTHVGVVLTARSTARRLPGRSTKMNNGSASYASTGALRVTMHAPV